MIDIKMKAGAEKKHVGGGGPAASGNSGLNFLTPGGFNPFPNLGQVSQWGGSPPGPSSPVAPAEPAPFPGLPTELPLPYTPSGPQRSPFGGGMAAYGRLPFMYGDTGEEDQISSLLRYLLGFR